MEKTQNEVENREELRKQGLRILEVYKGKKRTRDGNLRKQIWAQ